MTKTKFPAVRLKNHRWIQTENRGRVQGRNRKALHRIQQKKKPQHRFRTADQKILRISYGIFIGAFNLKAFWLDASAARRSAFRLLESAFSCGDAFGADCAGRHESLNVLRTTRRALRFRIIERKFQNLKFTFAFGTQIFVNWHNDVLRIDISGKFNSIPLEVKPFA